MPAERGYRGTMDEAIPPAGADRPANGLLEPDDPPPVRRVNPAGRAPVLLVCDHAGRAVPRALAGLGLAPAQLAQHIGWDIGAAAVTEHLAMALDAPALLGGYSRLVVDCNRAPNDPSLIPAVSDGVEIPGNRDLGDAARTARLTTIHHPYHAAIAAWLDERARHGSVPAIVSIHSFTPRMNGVDRPWQIGILWDKDPRIALPLLAGLARTSGLEIGDNQPYSARSPQGYSMARHAVERGLPHVLVELRQDEIATAEGAARYAGLLAEALAPILADRQLYRIAFWA